MEDLDKLFSENQTKSDKLVLDLPIIYNELRKIAAIHLHQERAGHTLLATDLVHEVYLRLFDGKTPKWNDKKHFFATAAIAMRRILVDHARKKTSIKRTDPEAGLQLSERLGQGHSLSLEEVLDLDIALEKLQQLDEKQAQIVLLRIFAGLTEDEVAQVVGISKRSVARQWWSANLWLREQMTENQP